MAAPLLELATADQLREILRRALEGLELVAGADDHFDRPVRRKNEVRFHASIEALRFVAAAAGALGDPSLIPEIASAIEALEPWDKHPDDHLQAACFGLRHLLAAGAPVDDTVRALAASPDAEVRQAVAEGLNPSGKEEIALLERLARDPVTEVRLPARAKLAKVREVEWWIGKWKSDPVARLSQEEQGRTGPAIARIAALLDEPSYKMEGLLKELAALAKELPDVLAVELAECVLSGARYGVRVPDLGTMMLAREGGIEALRRVVATRDGNAHLFFDDAAAEMIRGLDAARQVEVCYAFAREALTAPQEERLQQGGLPNRLAEIAGKAWPKEAPLAELLDRLLTIPPSVNHELDWSASCLDDALATPGADLAPIVDRVLAAAAEGFPGSWKRLGRSLETLLERAPVAKLRAAAERAVEGGGKEAVVWGIELLLGRAWDKARDPSKGKLAARLYADPRYHQAILDTTTLRDKVLPLQRAELRRGELDFRGASATLRQITTLWGGAGRRHGFLPRHEVDEEKGRRASRRALAGFLGPRALQGPPTDEEWRIYREARSRCGFATRHDWLEALTNLPEGPWQPIDRAVLEQGLATWRAGDGELGLFYPLAMAIAEKPSLADLALLEELIAREPADSHGLIQICREDARRTLGLAAEADEEESDPDLASDDKKDRGDAEWMDEPEGD
ncbi:MAG: hypothetical protein EXR72_24450 [Myxococcales bacterium]|nr:hypothetical protein [Myxococcales bacterium]